MNGRNALPVIVPKSQQRNMRWKNGRGITREVICLPQGSTIDSFDWRVSVARVEHGGVFSLFPGVDRSLAIIEGMGITIECAEYRQVLTPDSDIFTFEGETPFNSALIDGNVLDFNVMTRRARYRHRVEKLTLTDETREFHRQGRSSLFYVISGECTVVSYKTPLLLSAGDALLLEHVSSHCMLKAQQAEMMGVYLYSA
jgi:hypothetical protein